MALLWMDGFDIYASSSDLSANYSESGFGVTTNGSNWGTGVVTSDGNSSRYLALTQTLALNLWTSFRLRCDFSANQDQGLVQFFSPGGTECTISINPSTSVLKVWRGRVNDTLLGSVTMADWSINIWHWLDIHYVYHASAGVVEVWLDDSQVINLTSQNTANHASQTSLSAVALNSGNDPSGNTVSGKYDDWIINDTTGSNNNSRMGDCRIETLVPTSDATPNQATPSTGTSHYGVVDEPQYNTSDYLTMPNTSGDKEVFGMSDLSGSPAVIKGVCVRLASEKSDAGAFSLTTLVKSSGTEADGSSHPLSVSWTFQQDIFAVDPSTSAAWTVSGVNAMSAGYKVP